jgi:hypothetical protein
MVVETKAWGLAKCKTFCLGARWGHSAANRPHYHPDQRRKLGGVILCQHFLRPRAPSTNTPRIYQQLIILRTLGEQQAEDNQAGGCHLKTQRPTQVQNLRMLSGAIAKRYLDLQRLRDQVRKAEISCALKGSKKPSRNDSERRAHF